MQDLLQQCRTAETAFFFKQWGGIFKARNGRVLNNRTYDELPELPRHRYYPPSVCRSTAIA